jgi:hypothetical protein
MGGDWMPGGWTSASGINWPTGSKHIPASLQLAGQSYEPNRDFGSGHYFNGQSDNYVTRLGYRLWIDQSNIPHQAASPFIGFSEDPQYLGFGLRDGLRYLISSQTYHWTFTRPRFATTDPAIQIEAEFFASDGTVLFSQSQSFQAWQLRNVANGTDSLRWYDEPSQSTNTAFLHGLSMSDEQLQPVVEMKWDAGRPDEVGIRLADTAANDPVVRWRLRILDGSHQLWRKLQIGDRPWISPKDALDSGEVTDANPANPVIKSAILNVGDEANANLDLLLQTDETLPLQIVQRSDPRYAGLKLYQGLPLRIGVQIPPTLKPTLAVDVVDQHPTTPNTSFPGGPVFQAIRIELDAVGHDWIWLSAKSRE